MNSFKNKQTNEEAYLVQCFVTSQLNNTHSRLANNILTAVPKSIQLLMKFPQILHFLISSVSFNANCFKASVVSRRLSLCSRANKEITEAWQVRLKPVKHYWCGLHLPLDRLVCSTGHELNMHIRVFERSSLSSHELIRHLSWSLTTVCPKMIKTEKDALYSRY